MKVQVNSDKCQGHARCSEICPEVFQLDDQGYAFVKVKSVPVELYEQAAKAAAACPERAILVEDL